MKFLVDASLGKSFTAFLRSIGIDAKAVAEINPAMKDERIIEMAVEERRIVITLDKDFERMIWLGKKPHNGIIRTFFHFYLRWFVRPIGSLLSGNRSAYRYLTESAVRFYSPAAVREILMAAGFNDVRYHPLFFGAAGLHIATR